jgi:hypothetical protein
MDTIVLALIVILIALIITYYVVVGYLEGKTSLKYKSDMSLGQDPITIDDSDDFSYALWININKLNPNPTIILHREYEMTLFIENGALKSTFDKTYTIMDNFPLQKWVHIAITVENVKTKPRKAFFNAYIDGKLIKSYQTPAIEEGSINTNNLQIRQLDAKLAGLKRWKYPLNTKMVSNEFNAIHLTGDYNLDISVIKNEKLAKRFNVF